MYEELIRDREELRKMNADADKMAKDVDFSNPASAAKYEKAKKPFHDKLKAFRKKYESVFNDFNSTLVGKLSAGVEEGKLIIELIRADVLPLNLETMKLSLKIAVENGMATVVGGEICCQDKDGVLLNRISETCIHTEPLDKFQDGCRITFVMSADDPLRIALMTYFQGEWTRVHLKKK